MSQLKQAEVAMESAWDCGAPEVMQQGSRVETAMTVEKPKTRACDVCGTLQRVSHQVMQYVNKFGNGCSPECRATLRLRAKGIACKGCGTFFQPAQRGVGYCSRKCRMAAIARRNTRTCEWCGMMKRMHGRTKYCSPKCSGDARRGNGQARTKTECTFCRTVFLKRKDWIANGQRPFCSRKCFFARKRLVSRIRAAQKEFKRRLSGFVNPPLDVWDRYCKREANAHRNDNEKSFEKTWARKIGDMVNLNRHRQAMREEVEARRCGRQEPGKQRKKPQTWTRYLRNAMKRALVEVSRAADPWKIKCETWAGNQRTRMRRKAHQSRGRNSG